MVEAPAWNWTQAGQARPDHIHCRPEGREVVVLVTGSASGSIAGRLGGIRLPRAAAVQLAQFILELPADGPA